MTLTPVPVAAPPGRAAYSAGQDGTAGGVLQPLPVSAPNARARLLQLLRAMATDLCSRVQLDRWVRSLGCRVRGSSEAGQIVGLGVMVWGIEVQLNRCSAPFKQHPLKWSACCTLYW